MQRSRSVLVAGAVALCLTGCTHHANNSAPRPGPSPTLQSEPSGLSATLTQHERSAATKVARAEQRTITGTFIGATAFAGRSAQFDQGSDCDPVRHTLNIRLVWKADAGFVHGGVPGGPPDGPRKALLIAADSEGHVSSISAMYRDVGATPREALLYGQWPDPADG